MELKQLKDFLELRLLKQEFDYQDKKSNKEEYDDEFNLSCGKAIGLAKSIMLLEHYNKFENELNSLIKN